jgi:hypothetical protein
MWLEGSGFTMRLSAFASAHHENLTDELLALEYRTLLGFAGDIEAVSAAELYFVAGLVPVFEVEEVP